MLKRLTVKNIIIIRSSRATNLPKLCKNKAEIPKINENI